MLKREKELCKVLKSLMDEDANFVKPYSEFWRNTTEKEFPIEFRQYGLWLSGEGSSKINGNNVADYYNDKTFDGSRELKNFMKKYNLTLEWYDSGTIILYFK